MTAAEINAVSEDGAQESCFEIIDGDGQSTGSHPNQHQNQQEQEQLKKTSEMVSASLVSPALFSEADEIFIRLRRGPQKNKMKEEEAEKPSPVADAVLNSYKKPVKRVKSETETESEVDSDSDVVSCGSPRKRKGKLSVEKEILTLQGNVKGLMRLKSQVKKIKRLLGDDDDESDENGETMDEVKAKEADSGSGTNKKNTGSKENLIYETLRAVDTVLAVCFGLIFLSMCGLIFINHNVSSSREEIQSVQKTILNSLQENVQIIIKETLMESLKENVEPEPKIKDEKNVKETVPTKITKRIYFYSKKNYGGSFHVVFPWQLNENTCYNLNNFGDDFASSIDTEGECIYVFEGSDCQGEKYKFSPETIDHHDLGLWGLDKKISSLQACYKRQD